MLMIERLWSTVAKFANVWVFLALVVGFVLCSKAFGRFKAAYTPARGLDARGFYKPSDIPNIFAGFGAKIDVYLRQESTLDLGFPIVYALMYAVGIVWLGRSAPHWLIALPFATALFDYCENFSTIVMIMRYRETQTVPMAIAWIAVIATPVKTALFLASAGAVIVLALMRLYQAAAG